MIMLTFEKIINADQATVWQKLWGADTYPKWTSAFSADSRMQSDWQVNGRTLFLDGSQNGMISTISEMDEPNVLVFTHLGFMENGVQDFDSPQVLKMKGAQEKYFLSENTQGQTIVKVELDTDAEWEEMMSNGFTKGLDILKTLSESA